eukprot:EG_transcript_12544
MPVACSALPSMGSETERGTARPRSLPMQDRPPPSSARSTGAAGSVGSSDAVDCDIADLMDALLTPTDYAPAQLSFGYCGPLSADTQVFRLRNVCGKTIEVKDAAGQPFLKGTGHFKPVGYHFDFCDSTGSFAFSLCTLDLRDQEVYEFIGPREQVVATATRKRFNHRTHIRVGAHNRKSYTFVEVECKSVPGRSLLGGRYQVATPAGEVLGTIHRHYGKGVVTHQNFTVVVGPEVDPYLMLFLAVVCNCVNNERSKLGWALGAAGLAPFLL